MGPDELGITEFQRPGCGCQVDIGVVTSIRCLRTQRNIPERDLMKEKPEGDGAQSR
jgi:hypothetical protein